MTKHTWTLSVVPMGGTQPTAEVSIEAENWMNALARGRELLGENGGLPPGASCAVAPDGRVTVLDTAAAKTYFLSPDLATPVSDTTNRTSNKKRRNASRTVAYDTQQSEAAEAARNAPTSAGAEMNPTEHGHTAAETAIANAPRLELLRARDQDPRPDNPVLYRERTYFASPELPLVEVEGLLKDELDALKHELSALPAGKFVRMAAFSYRWAGEAPAAPVAQLQWKDWLEPRMTTEQPIPLVNTAKERPPASTLEFVIGAPVTIETSSGPPPASLPSLAPSAPPDRDPAHRRSLSRDHDDRLAYAFEALQDLFFLTNAAEALEYGARLLQETVPSEATDAALYDINHHELRFVTCDGPGSEAKQGRGFPVQHGLVAAALRGFDQCLVVNDVANDARYHADSDGRPELQPKTLLLAALRREGQVFGLLELTNRRSPGGFSDADANVVVYVASQLAKFLYRLRLSEPRRRR